MTVEGRITRLEHIDLSGQVGQSGRTWAPFRSATPFRVDKPATLVQSIGCHKKRRFFQ